MQIVHERKSSKNLKPINDKQMQRQNVSRKSTSCARTQILDQNLNCCTQKQTEIVLHEDDSEQTRTQTQHYAGIKPKLKTSVETQTPDPQVVVRLLNLLSYGRTQSGSSNEFLWESHS